MKDDKLARESEEVPPVPKITARQILWLAAVVLLFLVSITGTTILWGTTILDDIIDEKLMVKNGTQSFEAFLETPVTPILKVRVFNYTNVEDFRTGRADKLQVVEVGPYAFREVSGRVNVVFNDNDTVSFNDKKSYFFVPEMSNGSLDDTVFVINIPFMTLNYKARGMEYLKWLAATASLKVLDPEPIFMRTVGELMSGYKDTLTTLAGFSIKNFKIGLLETKNGTAKERVTTYTGVGNMSRIGVISRYDGLASANYYDGQCSRIDASDGFRFPPSLVRPDNTLYIYHREVCRRVPIIFKEHVKVWDDIPALRFAPPDNVFDNGEDNPDNACFCNKEFRNDFCLPSGVMDTSNCKDGSPIYASLPHFYLGDRSLRDVVDGLHPDPEEHSLYIDIHQRLGVPIGGVQRLQMSMLMKNTFQNSLLAKIHNKLLPMVWIERDCGEFGPELRHTFHLVSFTLPMVQATLQYGCPVVAVLTGLVLLVCIYVEVAAVVRKDEPDVQVTHF